MTSLIRLLVGFEYYLSARKTVNKWFYEEWKVCTLQSAYYSDTTDTNYSETLVPLHATC